MREGGPRFASLPSLCDRLRTRYAVRNGRVSLVGCGEIRERAGERHVVGVHSVAELVVRRNIEVRREGISAGDGPQKNVGYVVTETAPVREPVGLSRKQSEAGLLRKRSRWNRHVQAELLRRRDVGRLIQVGNAGERHCDEVVTWCLGNVHSRIENGDQSTKFRILHVLKELAVL